MRNSATVSSMISNVGPRGIKSQHGEILYGHKELCLTFVSLVLSRGAGKGGHHMHFAPLSAVLWQPPSIDS